MIHSTLSSVVALCRCNFRYRTISRIVGAIEAASLKFAPVPFQPRLIAGEFLPDCKYLSRKLRSRLADGFRLDAIELESTYLWAKVCSHTTDDLRAASHDELA